jgi:uncharacterized protein (TIGR02271 family)
MALNDNTTEANRLEELGGSNYEIVDGEQNIKGWDVKNEQGKKIGEVDELLFNPASRSVRYLVVDLDDNELELENDDRKVLIPIGLAELHSDDIEDEEKDENEDRSPLNQESKRTDVLNESGLEENETGFDENERAFEREPGLNEAETIYDPREGGDVVIVPNVTTQQLNALPAYEKDQVTPQLETTIRNIFEGVGLAGTVVAADDFYNHEHFNEDRFYNSRNAEEKLPVIKEDLAVGKREVETGGARITSRLVERPVSESIDLKEEHVNVERVPVNRPVTDAGQAFTESEIVMTEHAEVPLVSKEARVVEEISLNKEVSEKEETIRDTVRNTEVDIEQLPGKDTGGYTDSDKV